MGNKLSEPSAKKPNEMAEGRAMLSSNGNSVFRARRIDEDDHLRPTRASYSLVVH